MANDKKVKTDFRPNTGNDLKTVSYFDLCFILAELNKLLHEILGSGSPFQFSGLSLLLIRTCLGHSRPYSNSWTDLLDGASPIGPS